MNRMAALIIGAVLMAGCSQTSGTGTTMPISGYAFPPPAFQPFCAKEKVLCSTRGNLKAIELISARKAELGEVNAFVNTRIKEREDLDTTGKPDDWRLPSREGDCEDFAILKKSELMKLGWPGSVLLLTVVWRTGEGHTVLTVRTTEGDLVLDNKTSEIRVWSRTPYQFFSRQSQFDGERWERIGSAQSL